MDKINELLESDLTIINMGLESFAESMKSQGAEVQHVDWAPPAGGSTEIISTLHRLNNPVIKELIDGANQKAAELIINAQPVLVDIRQAVEVIPNMKKNLILNCSKKKYENLKYSQKVPLICSHKKCSKEFFVTKKQIQRTIHREGKYVGYCSKNCQHIDEGKLHKIKCTNCGESFLKADNQLKKTKNDFCSSSCAATFNNKNKKYGSRRSKLEKIIEKSLKECYPELIILPNSKEAIGSELDIYIPHFNLAIEINGIFHYQPIYGEEKLKQIQKNDLEKQKRCDELGIDLHIINCSEHSYINKKTSWKYVQEALKIVESKIY